MDQAAPDEIALERVREAERHLDDGDTAEEATARHVELHKQREEYAATLQDVVGEPTPDR